jgi:elongation factor P
MEDEIVREAQDLRVGNTVKVGEDLFIVTKFSYNKGARNASMVKMRLKNLSSGSITEWVHKAADKFEDVVLERRKMQYLYSSSGEYFTFMDQETFDQMDLTKDDLGDAINYIKEQMIIDVVLHGEKAVGVELPINVELKITYAEPAVRGDTGGKVMKAGKTETGFDVQVPLYINSGDMVRIDTRTGEFVARA